MEFIGILRLETLDDGTCRNHEGSIHDRERGVILGGGRRAKINTVQDGP
jgi:hypothetical protein